MPYDITLSSVDETYSYPVQSIKDLLIAACLHNLKIVQKKVAEAGGPAPNNKSLGVFATNYFHSFRQSKCATLTQYDDRLSIVSKICS